MKTFLTVLLIVGALQSASGKNKKPNILFIFADDMSYEILGSVGKTVCKTPNLDRLRKSGVSFTHAYNMGAWRGAVCLASRAMLNSGTFVNRAEKAVQRLPHWSEMMRDAGYRTYMTGKWHVPGKGPRFDVEKDVHLRGMPRQTESGYDRPKSPEDYAKGWKPWDKSKGGFWKGGTHWSVVVANDTLEFLKQAKKDDKPFFMYIAFNACHDPRQSPKKYIDMYPLKDIAVPKDFIPNYPYAKEMGCNPKTLRDERLMPSPRTEYAVKVNRQEYYALATHMDEQIGKIFKALKESGMAKNTYIIFTADNGLSIGHHGLEGKQNMYEPSMRVPFLIAGPGIKPGKSFDMPIYLQDAMATALELASIKKPKQVQFKSVLPLIRGERKVQYKRIYGKYINYQRMIKKGDYKLIVYPYAHVVRLYNLKKDPNEMRDLAKSPEYAPVVARLKAELKKLQVEMDDPLDIDHPPSLKKSKRRKRHKHK